MSLRAAFIHFGELLTGEGSGFRFNGEYYDSATGMLNLRARQYEPSTMRFNQRDVWHGTLALTLAQNRYQYCLNDPQNLYDYGGNIIAGKKTVLTPPRTIIKAADAKKTINTAAAIKAIAEQQRIDALSDTGIDTRGYNSDMRQIVENTEKELRRRARAGTLTAGDRQNLIATACNTIKTLQTWEQLKDPNYWKRSWDVAVKGDYAEDFTGAGLAMQVGLGLIPGVGQAADIRDFIYAVSHTKDNSFWVNAALITLALVALIPVVGDLAKGLKGVKYLKYADEAADVLDAAGDVAKKANGFDEVIEGGSIIRTQDELNALATDPAIGNKITAKTIAESEVGLGLEAQGDVGKLIRDPSGSAEFIDTVTGQKWDVKAFNSNYAPKGYNLSDAMANINKSITNGENVMLDTRNLSSSDLQQLLSEIEKQGLSDSVKVWP